MKSRRHRKLTSSLAARYERGNPPRTQSRRQFRDPTSERSKPPRSTNATLPASDSDTPRTSSGDALPRSKKRAGVPGRSARGRIASKSSGRRWTSSMMTRPSRGARVSSGSVSRARPVAVSRSKRWTSRRCAASWRASVVFPHWRGPRRAQTGLCFSAATTAPSDRRRIRVLGILAIPHSL